MPNVECNSGARICHSSFVIRHYLVVRASSFVIFLQRFRFILKLCKQTDFLRPELAGDLPVANPLRRGRGEKNPARPAHLHRHRHGRTARTGQRVEQARLRTAGHGNRPPAHLRRRALRAPGTGALFPREQLFHRRKRARHHPGRSGRLHAHSPVGHPAPVRFRPAPARRGADSCHAAGPIRHVQPRRVGGHREERHRKRLAGHRAGQPEHAADAGRLLHPRQRH